MKFLLVQMPSTHKALAGCDSCLELPSPEAERIDPQSRLSGYSSFPSKLCVLLCVCGSECRYLQRPKVSDPLGLKSKVAWAT